MEDDGIFNGRLVYFMSIWSIDGHLVYFVVIKWRRGITSPAPMFVVIKYIFPVLVYCTKKNLATVSKMPIRRFFVAMSTVKMSISKLLS
jgi:hypothetical protein